MYASDLFDAPDAVLTTAQANGWPWAESVKFSATDHKVAIIGRTIAGEEYPFPVERWRVTDLLPPDRQLKLPGIE